MIDIHTCRFCESYMPEEVFFGLKGTCTIKNCTKAADDACTSFHSTDMPQKWMRYTGSSSKDASRKQ